MPSDTVPDGSIVVPTTVTVTQAHVGQRVGIATAVNARIEGRKAGRAIGAIVPIVTLVSDDDVTAGVDNPIAFFEYLPAHLGGGVQVELPFGTFGDAHFMLLPYATGRAQWVTARVGLRLQVTDDISSGVPGASRASRAHGDEQHVIEAQTAAQHIGDGLLISPHGRSEVVWQTRLGPDAGPALQVDSAHVLDANAAERHFLVAGPALALPLEKGPVVRATAQWPFTTARRMDWRLGAGVSVGF